MPPLPDPVIPRPPPPPAPRPPSEASKKVKPTVASEASEKVKPDDRDPDRILRGRALRPNPTVQVRDVVLALVRDHGSFPDECADATMDALKTFCTMRQGPQHKQSLTGPGNTLDQGLLKHTASIIFQAASDGCETEVLGMRQLKVRKLLGNLRYFSAIVHTHRNQYATQ